MKNKLYLFVLILLSGFVLFTGCKKNKNPEPQVSATDKLARTWVPEANVTHDGAADSRFANFEVTFNQNGSYSSINGYPVFRGNGTWVFNSNNTSIILDGSTGPEFNITTLSPTNLQGSVNLQGGANARTKGIDGLYVFKLVPKP